MRRQAVAFFLGDTAFPADAKFRALARRLPDVDDFNSAVGAFFVALAAARRNGLPEIDVGAETGSRFVTDLVGVGLLCESGFHDKAFVEWSPKSPQQVAAGLARAATAERSPGGTFQPASTSALVTMVTSNQPSPPLPSTHISSVENVELAVPSADPLLDALMVALGSAAPSKGAVEWADRLSAEYGEDATIRALGNAAVAGPVKVISRAESALKESVIRRSRSEAKRKEADVSKARFDRMASARAEASELPSDPRPLAEILKGLS